MCPPQELDDGTRALKWPPPPLPGCKRRASSRSAAVAVAAAMRVRLVPRCACLPLLIPAAQWTCAYLQMYAYDPLANFEGGDPSRVLGGALHDTARCCAVLCSNAGTSTGVRIRVWLF